MLKPDFSQLTMKMELLLSCVSMVILYGIYFLMGFFGLSDWRNLREFIVAGIQFLVALLILRPNAIKRISWIGGLLFIGWALLIPAVVRVNAGAWVIDFNQASLYLRIGVNLGILFTFFFSCLKAKWLGYIGGLLGFICLLPPLVYTAYFCIYGVAFASADVLPVLHTTWKELYGYIGDQIGFGVALIEVIILSLGCIGCVCLGRRDEILSGMGVHGYIRVACSIIFMGGVPLYMIASNAPFCFPIKEYKEAIAYEVQAKSFQKRHDELVKKFYIQDSGQSLASKLPGVVLLIIGESANRDHMKAFNASYPVDTTPWLDSLRGKDGMYFYSHAYSNYPQTIPSLSMFLTGMNQYNHKKLTDTVSIMDAAEKAGYATWWISNQARLGGNDTPTTIIAESAENKRWTSPTEDDDKRIIPLLQEIDGKNNAFVVIHLMGSHMRYDDRVPPGFSGISNTYGANQKVFEYDQSLRYTDKVLQDIFQYAQEHWNLNAAIYCSDHGEDMVYGHGAGKFTFQMVRIPMFIYLSPEYRAQYPDVADNIQNHQDVIFTNDLIYDTLSGILRIPNSEYEARWDLGSAEYNLPIDEARTKHGQVAVSEDQI